MKNGLEGREATCTGEKGMTYIIIHVIWLVIKVVLAYDFTCPHPGQWNLIAETKNCSRKDYVCLLDDVKLKDTEACKSGGPRIENNGFKAGLNNGYWNAIPCSSTRFQPLQFSSFKDSRCVFEKSLCSEEGQVLADTGTAEIDRSCRCNYVKGYAFLANTSNLCSCIPSEEDCTCFRKPCSIKEILSQDYKCIKKTELQGIHQCTSISDRESIKPAIDVVSVNDTVPKSYNKVYRYAAATCCTIILVITIILSVFVVCCWKQTKRTIWHVWTYIRNCCRKIVFTKPLEDKHCIEGDSITFTCEVNLENLPGKWKKDGQKLEPSESLNISVDGRIHKLDLNSVTVYDSGEYTCYIKNKNSFLRLTVSEVIIIRPIEEQQQHIEGDKVTFTCEVNSEVLPGTWFKDGQELSGSDNLDITANGGIREIIIQRVTVEDRGYYSFEIGDKTSGGLLVVLDEFTPEKINYIRLYHLLETVAEPVVRETFDSEIHPNQLRKILNKNNNKILQLKHQKHINIREYDLLYPKGVEYSVKFTIKNYDCKRIHQNREENMKLRAEIEIAVLDLYSNVEGDLKVNVVSFESGSLIVVLQLKSNSDENNLKKILKTAVDKGKVGSFETESSGFKFTRLGNVQAASKYFDIRLMMVLMKNLIDQNITEVFPHTDDLTVVADLSRIKYLRNKVTQNSDMSIKDEDFDNDWKHLSEAVERLGSGTYKKKCAELKSLKPTLQHVKKYLNSENLQSNQGHTSTDSLRDHFFGNQGINLLARDAVRRIFDKQFPPLRLAEAIELQMKELAALKEERKITQSQWEDLFPSDKESLSSSRFDIKIMIILLSKTSFKEKDVFKTIENLQNHLLKPEHEDRAIKKAIKEINEAA